jgi:hypothetical protein
MDKVMEPRGAQVYRVGAKRGSIKCIGYEGARRSSDM